MTSSGGSGFPAVDIDKELNPGKQKSFEADTTAAEITTSLEIKEQIEKAEQRRKQEKDKEKKDAVQKFKSAVIISGIIAAIAGAAFAITKKMREK